MTVRGIDVSGYQTAAKWRAEHPVFLFAKASEGMHGKDAQFSAHIAQAKSRGVLAGAYHFGWPIQDVDKEVGNFLGRIATVVKTGAVRMLALDLEPYGDRRNTKGLTAKYIKRWAAEWVEQVEAKHPDLKVGIYASKSVFDQGWVPMGAGFYWVAQYPRPNMTYIEAEAHGIPKLGPGYPAPRFWQFTGSPLDRDLGHFASTREMWEWADPSRLPKTYVVKHGDTLSQIARTYGVTLRALVRANPQVTNPNLIYAGQRLHVPEPDRAA